MTAVNGKWKLISSKNLEEYHAAINTPEEFMVRVREFAVLRTANPDIYYEEYEFNPSSGTLRRAVFVDNEKKKELNYKIGVVNDGTVADGRPIKVTVGLVGDNKITLHETGSGFEIDGFVEAKGNELTMSLSSQGVTSTQTYTKI